MIYRPDITLGLECYIDADYSGGQKDGNHDSPESVFSRTGIVIIYAGCLITWGSKLQTEISLSTTESEYIALSSAMREVISFLGLMKETAGLFGLLTRDPVFRCIFLEDTKSCITVAKSPNNPAVSFIRPKNGITTRIALDRAMYLLSVVLRAISVCSLLPRVIGHPAYIITKTVRENTDSRLS